MDIPSIFFGLFFGLLVPTVTKAAAQTRSIWRRTRSLWSLYLFMIWVEAIVNLLFSLTTYLYLQEVIKPSLAFYFGAVTLWAIQTQLLSQIIANRVGLIIVNRRKARLLKWVLFALIACVNISVYCIWIPAHMPSATPTNVLLNIIWERVEKSIFLLIDLGLNFYFLYLLWYRLIADGLTKYLPLFKFNAAIVVVSLSMDILLLGLLSLPSPYDYVQFAPVAYIVKLHIELTMAELISKVVRGGKAERGNNDWYSSGYARSNRTHLASRDTAGTRKPQAEAVFDHSAKTNTDISGGRMDGNQNEGHSVGIMKTVTTVVKSDSTEELRRPET